MSLKQNPYIANAPIYVGGASSEEIRQKYGVEEIVKIGSNESPIGPSPKAIAAMQQAATTLNRYPPMGDEALRAVLAEVNGHGLSPDNFFSGNGGCDILNMVATAFLDEGDECIICRPTFPVYDTTARRRGASVVYVDLHPDDFSYDVEAMLDAVTERTRLIYVCSPNNPTGSIITAQQMETLVNNVPDHVLIVTDEVYHHFATHASYPNSLEYVAAGKNVLVVHSFSKALALAGLRLGYGIAPRPIIQYLARARLPFHLSRVTHDGGIAGVQDAVHIQAGVELVVAERKKLFEALSQLDLAVWPSEGNFMLIKPPYPAAEVSERLLQRGIIVRPMAGFYLPGHLRVSVGLPEENEAFIAALTAVLEEMGD